MQPQKKRSRILAVDVGLKRIGLAISDEQKIIASPLENLLAAEAIKPTIQRLLASVEKIKTEKGCEIEEIVIGLPLKMNGTESTTTEHVRRFAAALKENTIITVHLLDERLTSVQAERMLMDANFTRKKRAQFVDRVSAVILLQCYLDLKKPIGQSFA